MHYSTHLLRHTRVMIGLNIQKHRRTNQLSILDLAHISGVDEGIITRYEKAIGELHFHRLMRLACALDVPLGELVTVAP